MISMYHCEIIENDGKTYLIKVGDDAYDSVHDILVKINGFTFKNGTLDKIIIKSQFWSGIRKQDEMIFIGSTAT